MEGYTFNMGLRFREVAFRQPAGIALDFGGSIRVTYAELNTLSDSMARHLLARGCRRGSVVGLVLPKSVGAYAAMIACLKIGASYVALDVGSPRVRRRKILDSAQPQLLVVEEEEQEKNLPQCYIGELYASAPDPSPFSVDELQAVPGDVPAYIMFTSGSTGTPKGVSVSHASQLNFVHWVRTHFDIHTKDIISGLNPLFFDNAIFDFSASLMNGATLKPITESMFDVPSDLIKGLDSCTIWFSVPSLIIHLHALKVLSPDKLPVLRVIAFGGEGFPKAELKRLYDGFGRRAALWNVYGPAETTCICSAYRVSARDFRDMKKVAPLGHLAPNFTELIVDEKGSPVPKGEVGELYLGGPQLALGYHNAPDLTQQQFVKMDGARYYRTGDLVRRCTKFGLLHFQGRVDNQVKHMGYRVEIEEIEAAIAGLAQVVQCGVVYHKTSLQPLGTFAAFVQLREAVRPESLKEQLRDIIPDYMLPDTIHVMGALPKNVNGKVDRSILLGMLQ